MCASPLKIELHHSFFSPIRGGQETRMHALAGEFIRRGHGVTVVAPVDGVSDREQYEAKGIQFRCHDPFFTRVPKSLAGPMLYSRRLGTFHRDECPDAPDLILSFHYIYTAAAKRVWPATPVGFLAGAAIRDWMTSLFGHRKVGCIALAAKLPAALFVERLAATRAERIYIEGEMLKRRFLKFHRGSSGKLSVLSAPVDTARFSASPERRRRTRIELGIRETTKVIVGVGRLDKNKNYEALIRSASLLPQGDWVLLIVGGGQQSETLRLMISSLRLEDRVSLLPYRGDVEAIYSAADIFAHPSLLESYSNAVLEAMSSSLPCVVSSGPKVGVSYDLTPGLNALLVDPDDPGAWAAQIQALMNDPGLCEKLGREARFFCERRPTWGQIADRLLAELVRVEARSQNAKVTSLPA